jgi:hypothetical protein
MDEEKIFFIPYKNGGGTVVDWDFQSVIHCLNWCGNDSGYSTINLYLGKKNNKDITKNIRLHRLLMGFPEEVDHINGRRNDNRDENLRSVTKRKNQQNMKCHRDGKLVGASYYKRYKKYESRIKINEKNIYLGLFNTEMEAHLEYKKYIRDHNI